jgi:hypothetical protein
MDIAFIMGMILGFLFGIGFCLFFTDMLGRRLLKLLSYSPKKKLSEDDFDEDDPVNYWKPKGWRPDKPYD